MFTFPSSFSPNSANIYMPGLLDLHEYLIGLSGVVHMDKTICRCKQDAPLSLNFN